MTSDSAKRLLVALGTGDLDLRFPDGRSIRVHGTKLKLASLGGALHNLMEDVVEEQIAKRRRAETGSNTVPELKVMAVLHMDPWVCLVVLTNIAPVQ